MRRAKGFAFLAIQPDEKPFVQPAVALEDPRAMDYDRDLQVEPKAHDHRGESQVTTPEPTEPEVSPSFQEPVIQGRTVLFLAAWFGLLGGYIDLLAMVLRRKIFGFFYLQGRDFTWSVPLAGLVLALIPGLLIVLANRLRPGLVREREAAWILATTAVWGALLRLPILGVASLVLASGSGRWLSRVVVVLMRRHPRPATFSLAAMFAAVLATATNMIAPGALASIRPATDRPAPTAGSRNVLLIVLDTVRAESMSLHGYHRETTPNLARWSKRGVRFDRAVAPAPWSFASHSSFLTGQWPYKLGVHLTTVLDAPYPTLAEDLRTKGYKTAGFVANTTYCSYETRLDRGFDSFVDYVTSPRSILATSAPGRWIAQKLLDPTDPYGRKWTRFGGHDAPGINTAFLDWLSRGREDRRPYFALLNYFDAHEPFVLPEGLDAHFGRKPESTKDLEFLSEYWHLNKRALSPRETELAHDAYDDCISLLDRRVGRLLDELERRGVLQETLVVITSDHGEEFGEHGVYDHGFSLYSTETRVPLLVLGPRVPAGVVVADPVSLRDLAATIEDLAGVAENSPFPGRSLAESWQVGPGVYRPAATPAISEGSFPLNLDPQHGRDVAHKGYTMSLYDEGHHYIRNGAGLEELFDERADPGESNNLRGTSVAGPWLGAFRLKLLNTLIRDPGRPGKGGDFVTAYAARLAAQLGSFASPRPIGLPPIGFPPAR